MARSFSEVRDVPPLADFRHATSQRHYSVVLRDSRPWLRRTPNAFEKSIDYVIGSGKHAMTFAHRDTENRLLELPVSWYAEDGGHWNMSPGYDRPDHSDFRREVPDSCLFCHTRYPAEDGHTGAGRSLATGIDCQRCHGPGEAHAMGKGGIVNPAKLSAGRQLEVCLQCHMESASRTLPDSIRRFGRGPFSYRPGEALQDFTLYFEFAGAGAEERITVNDAGFGLLKSACFLRSAGRLTCTTCHDPHRQPREDAAALERYTSVCRSCHPMQHSPSTRDCTGCHMQKRRTEDAVHVVLTDHLIRKRPLTGNLIAPIAERHDRSSGPVKLLYPKTLPDGSENRVYLAMAEEDVAMLENTQSRYPEPYIRLAGLYRTRGQLEGAIRALKTAVELSPADPRVYVALSDAMLARGDVSGAVTLLEPAVDRMPRSPELLNSLAVLYADKQRFKDAIRLLSTALFIRSDDPLSWLNMGVSLEATGDTKGAASAFEQALRCQPDLARARELLTRLQRR
jgi:predicted CXXCH cytochrome family protein